MDSGNTSLKSKKIRVYPETELKITWRKWLGASRYCYNAGMAILRDTYFEGLKLPSAYDLRKRVMSKIPEWVNSTPFNLRGAAVLDAHAAFKNTPKEHKLTPFGVAVNPFRPLSYSLKTGEGARPTQGTKPSQELS